jgi:diguanylate cyclase (GGDEF)-like protein
VALHEELRLQRSTLERLNSLLFDDARRDPLTLVGNRLRLTEDLAAAAARVERYGHQYCVALLDIDFFKPFNDTLGHPAGDLALRSVAQALAGGVRAGDTVYRYGGEEFLVLLAEQTLESAASATERLLASIRDLGIVHPANSPESIVTVSAGLAELDPRDVTTVQEWLRRADHALYLAKAGGRNRLVVFDPAMEAA